MEALLHPRHQALIAGALALALAAASLWFLLAPARVPGPDEVRRRVEADCGRMEAAARDAVGRCLRRSDRLRADFASGRLEAAGLEPKEAVIIERDGIIRDYVGEVFYFKPIALPPGGWQLIRRNQDVYFLRRVGERAYHIRFFLDMRSDPIRVASAYRYPVFELKVAGRPLPDARSEFSHDRALGRFYCTRPLPASQNQLVLALVLSADTLAERTRRDRRLLGWALGFLFFLLATAALRRPGGWRPALRLAAVAGMALALWQGIAWLAARDLFFPGFPAARSVFQLLALLTCLYLGVRMRLDRARRGSGVLALVVFNSLAGAAFAAAAAVLRRVDFPFGDFTLDPRYLGLLALLIGLHAAPLLAAGPFIAERPLRRTWPLLLAQAALLLLPARFLAAPPLAFPALAAAFALLLLRPRRGWVGGAATLALVALAVHSWLGHYALQEKRAFISGNLKPIFASQDDYAKLVAREIVYELNSRSTPFSSFFEPGGPDDLGDDWKNTLAARESIASGIHVVAADGELRHSFSYQVPYIPLVREDVFPFWHVENVDAVLFGKKVRLAVATINVFARERYLGYVMVQVLNTAELVLKSREQQSILNVDRKLRDAGLGYVKLDGERRILENPANINVRDLAALARASDSWVRFRSMGTPYSGYVFPCGEGTAIIFFPRKTFFTLFAEYVGILGFLLLLAAVLHLRRMARFQWRRAFGSFSVKVFAILVLLSMLTAAVFSLFFLNFSFTAQETQRSQAAYDRGRAALNIINNLLAGGNEMTQSHMFLLGKILENDISVYERGTLLFTSDHRKIIRSQLPVHLNSGIRDLLQRDNQQFELRRSAGALDLFFKTEGGYVFDIEFPVDSADQLRARRAAVDFMVTVFFFLIVVGLAAAFFFRNQIVAPIHRLNRGMADVQKGDLRPLPDVPAETELRELYQGFNSMLEGIQEQKNSASEIARMKTLVQLGRRVAHEVKNPLTPIRLSAEQILRTLKDKGEGGRDMLASAARYIIEETEHLRRVAFGFLNLSRLEELKPEPFRLDELVAEAVARLRPLHPRVAFAVAGATIAVVADRQKIRQAIDNVLTNALEALTGRDGEIGVTLAEEDDQAQVRIRDNGEGISGEELERIAREEFSSKDLGTGLGLVIARRFLELHGGGLEIESRRGAGTTVTLRFAKHVSPA